MSAAQKLFVGFSIIIVRTAIAQRSLIVELQSVHCSNYAPEWFKTISCELSHRNDISFINAHLMLQKPAPIFNVRIVLEYYMATGTAVKLLDKNIDGCGYLKQATQETQYKIVHKYLKKFVNKIPVCPLEESFNYTIRELYVDIDDIPKYLPDCTFRLNFHRISDIYVTLISYVVPNKSDAFLQINCSLTPIVDMLDNGSAKSHPAIYFRTKPAYDITDIKVNVNISIEHGGRYDSYLSTEVDLCEMRYSKIIQPVLRYFRDELIRVVKPKEFCPIKKNALFEVNNFILGKSFLPAYVPPLNWKADLKLWLNGRYSVALVAMGKIEWINI